MKSGLTTQPEPLKATRMPTLQKKKISVIAGAIKN